MNKLQMKIESQFGSFYLVASEKSLHGIFWEKQNIPMTNDSGEKADILLKKAAIQLDEYLNGKRKTFELPLDAQGTKFQKKVWEELAKIPYGETRSYKQIAIAMNHPKASRAVGNANGKNPLSIIVPCHRVIASDGSIGGYAGGLDMKRRLLDIEMSI